MESYWVLIAVNGESLIRLVTPSTNGIVPVSPDTQHRP
jgi:hypothetical protein